MGGTKAVFSAPIDNICSNGDNYLQFQLGNNGTLTDIAAQLEISVVRTLSFNSRNTLSQNVNPQKDGRFFFDLSTIIDTEKKSGKSGIVFKVATTDCNVDLYINSNSTNYPSSFSDSSSIFVSSSDISTTGEVLPISFLSSFGSTVMLYHEQSCQFTFSYEELKQTTFSMNVMGLQNVPSLSNVTSIQIKIANEYHRWDNTYLQMIRSTPMYGFKSLKGITTSGSIVSLDKYFESYSVSVVDYQTVQFNLVPMNPLPSDSSTIKAITFESMNQMFLSRYDIQPSNMIGLPSVVNGTNSMTVNDATMSSATFFLTFIMFGFIFLGM